MTVPLNSWQLRLLGHSVPPPMANLPPAEPYDWIREWWGDELSPDLVQLICAAP